MYFFKYFLATKILKMWRIWLMPLVNLKAHFMSNVLGESYMCLKITINM